MSVELTVDNTGEGQELKRPFDINVALTKLDAAVRPYPKAALFELADLGHRSAFEQLVACIISIRTRDEVTLPVARALFGYASAPAAMLALSEEQIDDVIAPCTFHTAKALHLRAISQRIVDEYQSETPCSAEVLLSFPGVGPKCAHLVLGIACGQPRISVDIHVHRVTNRWGYVRARTPEQTLVALESVLPAPYAIDINRILVPFGKHICTGALPHCSTCPVLDMCEQVGVDRHR